MCVPITEAEMIQSLYIMKETLDKSKQIIQNIVFINNECFYSFLNQLSCSNGETIGVILNKLEHCIPFALTDNSFSLFISSCQSDDIEKMEALRRGFIESCKNDFLLHLFSITNKIQWEHILQTCKTLRKKNRTILRKEPI